MLCYDIGTVLKAQGQLEQAAMVYQVRCHPMRGYNIEQSR